MTSDLIDDDYVSVPFKHVKTMQLVPCDVGEWPSYQERIEMGDTEVL